MAARRVVVGSLLVLATLAPLPAHAQSTRVDAIGAEQADKARHLGVEDASDAEKIVKRVLQSPLLSGDGGVYPWFGSVYGGSGMSAGVGVLHRLQRAASINAQAGVSINGSMMARTNVVAPELWRGLLRLDATAGWTRANDVAFYGVGQQSSQHRRQDYRYEPTEVAGNVTLRPIRFVAITGSYAYLGFSSEREHERDNTVQFGLERNLDFNIWRQSIVLDTRPAPAYSTRGTMLRATFEQNAEASGRPYSFKAQEYEASQLVPLVKEQFVIALRGLVTLTSTAEGQHVPVPMAPYLGSGSTLRGFGNRRFTDRNRALLSGEYRWRPSRYLDMALFMDAGQVAPTHDFDLDDFDIDWGIGARFHGPTFTAWRVELARGREGLRMVFAGSQAF